MFKVLMVLAWLFMIRREKRQDEEGLENAFFDKRVSYDFSNFNIFFFSLLCFSSCEPKLKS